MERLRNSLQLRYGAAIVLTSALMIWISVNEDAGRDAVAGQIAFWSVAVTAGWLQMILISRGVRATFASLRWPGWALMLAGALIGAVPLTFEVRWLLETVVPPVRGMPPPWWTYLNVSVINAVFCLVQYVLIERWSLHRDGMTASRPDESAEKTGAVPNIARLSRRPEGLSGIIRYMQMEDHYLRVVTDQGEGMALHRMGDACRELAPCDGHRVHRSWWVSGAAISDMRRANRKWTIVTTDGTEIPVARSFEKDLREIGWM